MRPIIFLTKVKNGTFDNLFLTFQKSFLYLCNVLMKNKSNYVRNKRKNYLR